METGAMNQDASSFSPPLTFTDFPPLLQTAPSARGDYCFNHERQRRRCGRGVFHGRHMPLRPHFSSRHAVMRAAEAEYLITHLRTEADSIVAVVSYTDSL